MRRHDHRSQALAGVLAALAGFVDATGFLASGGYFVSFMSGNSTRLGVGLAGDGPSALVAAGLIACFLAGAIVGALCGHAAGRLRQPVVLCLVAALLAGAAGCAHEGWLPAALGLLAAAMGALNNTFEQQGEVSIGVTYMTGSLVKLGQRIAAALLGSDRRGWLPYLMLWACFVAGVTGGAAAYPAIRLEGLWGAAALAFAAAAIAPLLNRGRPEVRP